MAFMHPTSMKATGQMTKICGSLFLSTHMVIILLPVGAGIKHEKWKASKKSKNQKNQNIIWICTGGLPFFAH